MKKTTVRVETDVDNRDFNVVVLGSRFRYWLFHRFYTIDVMRFPLVDQSEEVAKPVGRVTKTKAVEFSLERPKGGRVVRIMPKQLKGIKEAQEKLKQ